MNSEDEDGDEREKKNETGKKKKMTEKKRDGRGVFMLFRLALGGVMMTFDFAHLL